MDVSAEQPLDRDAALDRLGGDDELLQELIGLMLEQSRELVGDIGAALDRGDAEVVCRAAHTIKGSAANLEAGPLRDTAGALEDLARSGSLAGAEAACAAMNVELERLAAAVAS